MNDTMESVDYLGGLGFVAPAPAAGHDDMELCSLFGSPGDTPIPVELTAEDAVHLAMGDGDDRHAGQGVEAGAQRKSIASSTKDQNKDDNDQKEASDDWWKDASSS